MTDATIAVSLVRRVGFYKPNPRPRVPLLSEPSPPPALARSRNEKQEQTPSLSTSKSIGDLRSLRKKLRDVMPPMPRLDTSAAVISMKDRDSPTSSPEPPPTPPTPPSAMTVANLTVTPSASSSKERGHKRMLQRVVRSAPPVLSGFRFGASARGGEAESESGSPLATSTPSSSVWRKPLPTIPQEGDDAVPRRDNDEEATRKKPSRPSESNNVTVVELIPSKDKYRVTDSRTLHTDVSVGFPKRPKGRTIAAGSHPSLETVSSLPDGLYKGSIPLQKGWFPSLQWDGLTIEYFLEVSVIFDNAVFKGHVPIRLF